MGMYASDTIYNDLDVGPIHAIPETNPHRKVDIAIVEASKQGIIVFRPVGKFSSYDQILIGYLKTYLVIPSVIWGLASGRLAELGVQNRHSIAIPWILKRAVAQGKVRVVGEGKHIWGGVQIDEREYGFFSTRENLDFIVTSCRLVHHFVRFHPQRTRYCTWCRRNLLCRERPIRIYGTL